MPQGHMITTLKATFSKHLRKEGPIVLIGGAEDKTGGKAVLRIMVERVRAERIAVIPTASGYPQDVFSDYRRAFESLGVAQVDFIDVREKSEAGCERWGEALTGADLFFFSGGDQEKLVGVLDGTPLLDCIRDRHAHGVAIAGTSAGASALGDPMILEGNGNKGLLKRHVTVRKGFGFLPRVVVDTHFMERGRIPRLAQIVSSREADAGIGLSEDTAAFFSTGDRRFQVIGGGVAAVLCGDALTFSNYDGVGPDEQVAFDGMRFSVLSQGMAFDMSRCRIAARKPAESDPLAG